jgi:hypothetical protein
MNLKQALKAAKSPENCYLISCFSDDLGHSWILHYYNPKKKTIIDWNSKTKEFSKETPHITSKAGEPEQLNPEKVMELKDLLKKHNIKKCMATLHTNKKLVWSLLIVAGAVVTGIDYDAKTGKKLKQENINLVEGV